MEISFDLYRIFYHVANNKSITAAARELFVTQPTVTHSIQNLEKQLGCSLFHRSKKGVLLTPEGELLYKHVRMAYKEIAEAEKDLVLLKEFTKGEVSIGASETTLHYFLFSYLKQYKERYPQIRLKVHNYNTLSLISALKEKRLDFGILVCPQDFSDSELIILPLTSFSDVVIAGPEYSELSGRPVSLEELSHYPLIVIGKGNSTNQILQKFFQKNNLEMLADIELTTSDLIVPAVINGLGVGFVPNFFAMEALQKGIVFQINLQEKMEKRNICLVYRKEQAHSIAAKECMNLFLNHNL